MLAPRHRLRTAADFSRTVRSGSRHGRRNVVLYASATSDAPSRLGFIVSKAVGNAVTRNLVKRRLREAGAMTLRDRPRGIDVVVRALPASAGAGWEGLLEDYRSALGAALRKIDAVASDDPRKDA